jgi:hypothetical protein
MPNHRYHGKVASDEQVNDLRKEALRWRAAGNP